MKKLEHGCQMTVSYRLIYGPSAYCVSEISPYFPDFIGICQKKFFPKPYHLTFFDHPPSYMIQILYKL